MENFIALRRHPVQAIWVGFELVELAVHIADRSTFERAEQVDIVRIQKGADCSQVLAIEGGLVEAVEGKLFRFASRYDRHAARAVVCNLPFTPSPGRKNVVAEEAAESFRRDSGLFRGCSLMTGLAQ
jgi:hypothetical protein